MKIETEIAVVEQEERDAFKILAVLESKISDIEQDLEHFSNPRIKRLKQHLFQPETTHVLIKLYQYHALDVGTLLQLLLKEVLKEKKQINHVMASALSSGSHSRIGAELIRLFTNLTHHIVLAHSAYSQLQNNELLHKKYVDLYKQGVLDHHHLAAQQSFSQLKIHFEVIKKECPQLWPFIEEYKHELRISHIKPTKQPQLVGVGAGGPLSGVHWHH